MNIVKSIRLKKGKYDYVALGFTDRGKYISCMKFHTGDVVKDYRKSSDIANYAYNNDDFMGVIEYVFLSSSCDEFTTLVSGYKWIEEPIIGELIVHDK